MPTEPTSNDSETSPASRDLPVRSLGRYATPSLLVSLVVAVLWTIPYSAPPRFDETGYLILAKSLAEGLGYREIDKPGAPLHAHFPPGWPLTLAAIWSVVPDSIEMRTLSAHAVVAGMWAVSLFCWVRWYASTCPRRFVPPLAIALAGNWLWIRLAGELRSESAFILISGLVLLVMTDRKPSRESRQALLVGVLTGIGILTRHVGIALAAAVIAEFALRQRRKSAVIAAVTSSVVVAPWLFRQIGIGRGTQAELILSASTNESGLIDTILSQCLFYVRRLPDSLFGPFVETATVFRDDRNLAMFATIAATAFAFVLSVGTYAILRNESTRTAGIYMLVSASILVVWPFTEAGRFLIPLVPLTLIALAFGTDTILSWRWACFRRTAPNVRRTILCVVLGMGLPFGIYALAKNAQTVWHVGDYERACAWIRAKTAPDAVLSARHPGDAYWRTGRVGVGWPNAATMADASKQLRDSGVDFLLLDGGRYVGEPKPAWLPSDDATQPSVGLRKVWPSDSAPSDTEIREVSQDR